MTDAPRNASEQSWEARLRRASVSALYLHLPFCARKCAYCDFSSWEHERTDPLMAAYADALACELAELSQLGLLEGCETAYIGGGTPTLLGTRLAALVRNLCAKAPDVRELTCEANPDSLAPGLPALLGEAGCTRFSLGVQSLDDDELRALGRLHDAARARSALREAVSSGLAVSCDLMCAIPGQTAASFGTTLAGVIACGVGHVSVYPLQIEEGTPLARAVGDDEPAWNDPEVQAARMRQAQEALSAAGFARYEVASYARAGRQCRHNCAYWTGQPYLGLGTSASSLLTREAYERLRTASPQLPRVPDEVQRIRLTCTDLPRDIVRAPSLAARTYDLEALDEAQAAAEDLMLAMRMTQGVGPALLAHAHTALGADEVEDALAWCAARGLAQERGGRWVPTDQGWLLGNELYGRLWDLAPAPVETL